jgi:hypothetical protein
MNLRKSMLAGGSLLLMVGVTGCGMVTPHADCDQVAQQQRGGATDADIAKATGYSVDQVQSCSQTGTSGGRETANNYQDQPRLPAIPVTIPAGAIGTLH